LAAFGAGRARHEPLEVVGAACAEAATAAECAAGDADAEEWDGPCRGVEEGVEGKAEGEDIDGEPEGEFGAWRLSSVIRAVAGLAATAGLKDE